MSTDEQRDDERKAKTEAVAADLEEQRDAKVGVDAARMVAGYAAPLHPDNTLPREEIERRAHEAMGIAPDSEAIAASHLGRIGTGGASVRVERDEDVSRRVERERGGDPTVSTLASPAADTRAVIVNGVAFVVPVGEDVEVPEAVADVLKNAERPLRTAQAAGFGALPTVDLRRHDLGALASKAPERPSPEETEPAPPPPPPGQPSPPAPTGQPSPSSTPPPPPRTAPRTEPRTPPPQTPPASS